VAVIASACTLGERALEPAACATPTISRSTVTSDAPNVLSALVTADVTLADSVIVRFGVDGNMDGATPSATVDGEAVRAPVLGLHASTSYGAQLVAYNSCGATTGPIVPFTTAALPSDLPTYTASTVTGTSPSPGYTVFAAGAYGLAIDDTGRVVWYYRFPNGPGLNFQAQPNGRYAARPPSSGGDVAAWVELAPDGAITRTFGCASGLQPRMHDLIAEPDGSYWTLCDDVRTVDLSAQGKSKDARVLGTSVQHRSVTGDVLFDWSAFDHLEIELRVLDPVDRDAAVVNWTHGNALDLDSDGNLLVSFRNLSEVTKIDTRIGGVMWRLGGAHNAFAFENVDGSPFVHQHGVRAVGAGQLLLLDNLGEPQGSRAERYEIDAVRRVVRLRESYGSAAGFVAQVGGSTQALPNGHTLVSFGSAGGVEEYDAAGTVVWRLAGNPGYVFRAQRVRSLYHPGVGDPR